MIEEFKVSLFAQELGTAIPFPETAGPAIRNRPQNSLKDALARFQQRLQFKPGVPEFLPNSTTLRISSSPPSSRDDFSFAVLQRQNFFFHGVTRISYSSLPTFV